MDEWRTPFHALSKGALISQYDGYTFSFSGVLHPETFEESVWCFSVTKMVTWATPAGPVLHIYIQDVRPNALVLAEQAWAMYLGKELP